MGVGLGVFLLQYFPLVILSPPCFLYYYEMILIHQIYATIMTEVNVSATVEEMSATVEDMSATVGTLNMFKDI